MSPSVSSVFAPLLLLALVHAAAADTPLPPLQWLNLTTLLQGSSQPPPLKNALVGYDDTSRTFIIFGGESAGGLPQSQTYLLNLDTLTWSVPSPPPTLNRSPPARTTGISGCDFAASNRHGFVVIGGVGSNGQSLSDVWEYDFNHQFWSQVNLSPGGPSARWGAAGGIDISTPPVQDPIVPGPNNTFYLTGGFDGVLVDSLSEVWRLNLSGTLSPNLPDNVSGSWDNITVGNDTPKFNHSATVILDKIILTGGCNSTGYPNNCPQQTSYIIDSNLRTQITPTACPAPRSGPILVRNPSTFAPTYSSQVLLLLGTINATLWDDGGALNQGEVAVLDIDTGLWSRVLPSGDPGRTGQSQFPTPREGAAAVSYPLALVGSSREGASDTIIFGGQDASGNYLSEVWLLRAYNSSVTASNPSWSGFGNGHLQTGVDASGSGVQVTYLTSCATPTTPTPQPSSSILPSSGPSNGTHHDAYDTSTTHMILAPLSLGLFQITFLFFRLGSPFYGATELLPRRTLYGYIASVLGFASYALGCGGIATSFTSVSGPRSVHNLHLQTGHGISALALFTVLYAFLPILFLLSTLRRRWRDCQELPRPPELKSDRGGSIDAPEKISSDPFAEGPPRSSPHSVNISPTSSPRRRTNSWGFSGIMQKSQEGSDSESGHSATMTATVPSEARRFEVLNRPIRTRKTSNGLTYPPYDASPDELASTSLTHIDWLQRRRSLNAVGELDYAITQARRELLLSSPATAEELVPQNGPKLPQTLLPFPSPLAAVLHVIFQILLLGLVIVTLLKLWSRATAAFAVFLVWTIVFYVVMIALACRLPTHGSLMTVLSSRLFFRPLPAPRSPPQPSPPEEPNVGPYVHHKPPYRAVSSPVDANSYSRHGGHRSNEVSDADSDLDEVTRQHMIEEEMGRREVSIITVPRRKLWIANPS